MQLLRDNLTLWTSDAQVSPSKEKYHELQRLDNSLDEDLTCDYVFAFLQDQLDEPQNKYGPMLLLKEVVAWNVICVLIKKCVIYGRFWVSTHNICLKHSNQNLFLRFLELVWKGQISRVRASYLLSKLMVFSFLSGKQRVEAKKVCVMTSPVSLCFFSLLGLNFKIFLFNAYIIYHLLAVCLAACLQFRNYNCCIQGSRKQLEISCCCSGVQISFSLDGARADHASNSLSDVIYSQVFSGVWV